MTVTPSHTYTTTISGLLDFKLNIINNYFIGRYSALVNFTFNKTSVSINDYSYYITMSLFILISYLKIDHNLRFILF